MRSDMVTRCYDNVYGRIALLREQSPRIWNSRIEENEKGDDRDTPRTCLALLRSSECYGSRAKR